jgi:membrane protease YdiL (CAAX protease family)
VTSAPTSLGRPLAFFAVLLALAIPIWLLSPFLGVIRSVHIPVSDLMLGFTPLAAGCVLTLRAEGAGGLVALLKRVFAFRTLARTGWLAAVLLLAPFIDLLTWVGLHLAGHVGEAKPNYLGLPVLAAIMFVLAIGEEVGWTGYLLDPLQARFGALGASLIIAIPWWLGHIPSILEIGGTAADIAWWFPGALALRVIMTWLYNNTGRSLAAVVLFHMMLNLARSAAFPAIGAHYDPAYQALAYTITFALAVVIVMVWGPETLMRVKRPPQSSSPPGAA